MIDEPDFNRLHRLGLYESWIISISLNRQGYILSLNSRQKYSINSRQKYSKWWREYGNVFQK